MTQHVQAAMATTCGTVAAAAPSRRRPWALWQHANDEADAATDAGAMSSVSSVDATSGFNPLGPRVGTWVTVGAGETSSVKQRLQTGTTITGIVRFRIVESEFKWTNQRFRGEPDKKEIQILMLGTRSDRILRPRQRR